MNSEDGSVTPLCARGCGFYGTAENRNLCSKCYDDYLKHEIIAKTKSSTHRTSKSVGTHLSSSTKIDSINEEEKETAKVDSTSTHVVKNRCETCNKKVGFTGFACRCEKVFCGKHRYPKDHSCTYDFKKADHEILGKQNPLLKGDKLDSRV